MIFHLFECKLFVNYLWEIKFKPTIEIIRVHRKNILSAETGSFKINIPARTVKMAPNPAQTAYPILTFTPLSIALYSINMLNETDSMNESIQRYISLPDVTDILDKLNANTASNNPPIINSIQFIIYGLKCKDNDFEIKKAGYHAF